MELNYIIDILISLFTLTILEVVLGVDNLVFISIASNRLPKEQQKTARRVGLALALITRLILLASVVWLIGLTQPWFSVFGFTFSASSLILIGGGLFLLFKSTVEIHAEFEIHNNAGAHSSRFSSFLAIVCQIAVLDIIFSLDSVMTAVGLTRDFWIMATAIFIAILAMIFASEPLSRLVNRHPTIKMLALSFLILIGTTLIADGFGFHIPRPYIYFAVCFSIFVELLNSMLARKRRTKKLKKMQG